MKATMFGDEVAQEYTSSNTTKAPLAPADLAKLSNKARRRLQKEEESKEREAEYNQAALIASAEGRQFAVSQSIVDVNDPVYQNALDVVIPNFSISAHKKELLVNAELNIIHVSFAL